MFDQPQAPAEEKRTRKSLGRIEAPERPPVVIEETMGGRPVIRVEIFGRVVETWPEDERYVLMDAEDWPRIRAIADWWGVATASGYDTIGRGTNAMARVAKQAGTTHPNAALGRLILGATKGQRVVSGSGDPRDLRKCNLYLADDHADEAAFRRTANEFLRAPWNPRAR